MHFYLRILLIGDRSILFLLLIIAIADSILRAVQLNNNNNLFFKKGESV